MRVVLSICLFNGSELLHFFMNNISTVQKMKFNCMHLCTCKTE